MAKKKSDTSQKTITDPGKNKTDALNMALAQIEKEFGNGAIMRLGNSQERVVDGISTGAYSLDVALGGKGLPRGRVIEIYGPEGSGKTTLCLHAVASAQSTGGIAAFIDAEHALDPSYAKKLGVNLDDLLISQPDCGEQALDIAEMLVRSNAVDIIVIDSVAALVPKAEIEGAMGDQQVGLQARLMSRAMRKLTSIISKTRTCVVFINQLRMKIGVMFGNPETTPGGKALKFYSSVRLDIRRIGGIKEADGTVLGNHCRVKVVKNKVAPPFRQAEFDIYFDSGISNETNIIDLASKYDIIKKSGAWLSYNGEHIGQGREKARFFLKDNPAIMAEITESVQAAEAEKAEA